MGSPRVLLNNSAHPSEVIGQFFLRVFSQSKIFSGAFGASQLRPKNLFGASNNSGSAGGRVPPTAPPTHPPLDPPPPPSEGKLWEARHVRHSPRPAMACLTASAAGVMLLQACFPGLRPDGAIATWNKRLQNDWKYDLDAWRQYEEKRGKKVPCAVPSPPPPPAARAS